MPLCNGVDIGCVSIIDNITGRESGPSTRWNYLSRAAARWMDLNDSCEKNSPQENVSSPLEVRNRVSISSVTRMTSSSPVNRKNYWKEKSSPWSSSSCKNEVLNSLRRRQSLRTWSTALISSDKTCADIPTGNCSSSLPRRMLEPSWRASDESSKLHMACLPPI